MSTIAVQRTAFDQVCRESFRGWAEVTVMCPKCREIVKTYVTDVNGFNDYAFKRNEREYKVGDKTIRYYRSEFNGHGCCF